MQPLHLELAPAGLAEWIEPSVRGCNAARSSIRRLELLGLLARLEAHHPDTVRHSRRVRRSALRLAAALGLPGRQRRLLGLAARLHDVGKIEVPAGLLDKRSPLTERERNRLCQHAARGERLLARLVPHPSLLQAVRHHHERFDGRGYPDGLAGRHIPLAARILAIVDSFDAMTHARPYRGRRTREEAVAELRAQAGRQFDPELVRAFLRTMAPSEEEVGMVEKQEVETRSLSRRASGERRTALRLTWKTAEGLPVVLSDGEQARWGRTADLSRQGIALVTCFPFTPGVCLSVRLRAWTSALVIDRVAEVVYTRPQSDGTWRVGCRFTQPLAAEELESLT